MRVLTVVLLIIVVGGLGFVAGYILAQPPSEARPCVDAVRNRDNPGRLADQCRALFERQSTPSPSPEPTPTAPGLLSPSPVSPSPAL